MEAANRLNRRAAHAIAGVEAHRLMKASGIQPARELDDVFAFIDHLCDIYGPSPLTEMEVTPIDGCTYEVEVTKCFVAANIARAGIADVYECAVFDRLHGWHEAAGLPLAQEFPAIRCPLASGGRCRQLLRLAGENGEARDG